MSKEYYYQMPGGKVGGPLPLGAIRAAISAGRLEDNAMVSERRDDPVWVTVKFAAGESYYPQGYVKPVQAAAVVPSSLHACSGCGKDIHIDATTCPHCGKTFTSAARIGLIVILTLLILFLLAGRVVFL